MNLAIPWVSNTQPNVKLWCTQSTTLSQTSLGSAFLRMISTAFSSCTVSDAGKIRRGSFAMMVFRKASKCRIYNFTRGTLRTCGKHIQWQKHHFLLMFASSPPSPLGSPLVSPNDPVVPTESVPPEPGTPAACDPALSFDAISTLRGEILFFTGRSVQKTLYSYLFFWCINTMLREENK